MERIERLKFAAGTRRQFFIDSLNYCETVVTKAPNELVVLSQHLTERNMTFSLNHVFTKMLSLIACVKGERLHFSCYFRKKHALLCSVCGKKMCGSKMMLVDNGRDWKTIYKGI